ncbi:MAG: hypothetical protein IJN39_01080 [Clostridia bacterium]|nr:hypothetical protein [Clostridia bacterium]
MTIIKLIGIVFCFTFIVIFIKQYRPEFALPVTVCGGIWAFFYITDQVDGLFMKMRDVADLVGIDILYIEILFKIVGVSYLCEFSSAVCKDCGQAAFGVKIELVGKLMILSASIPVFNELLKIITSILP